MPAGDSTGSVEHRLPHGVTKTEDVPASRTYHEVVTVAAAGTRVQMPKLTRLRSVTFQGASANVGVIYFGDKSVTNGAGVKPGFGLGPRIDSDSITVHRLEDIWVDADNNGDILVIFGVGS